MKTQIPHSHKLALHSMNHIRGHNAIYSYNGTNWLSTNRNFAGILTNPEECRKKRFSFLVFPSLNTGLS